MKTVMKYMKPYLLSVIFCLTIKGVAAFFELLIPRMLAIIIDEDVPRGDLTAVFQHDFYGRLIAFHRKQLYFFVSDLFALFQ